MTGTARETAAEVWNIYRLPVLSIRTNRPCIRKRLPERVFMGEPDKWQAVVAEFQGLHALGPPLVGGDPQRCSQ